MPGVRNQLRTRFLAPFSFPMTMTCAASYASPFTEIRPGNAAMHYPKANVLVGRQLDPSSKTPAFKCAIVRLELEGVAQAH